MILWEEELDSSEIITNWILMLTNPRKASLHNQSYTIQQDLRDWEHQIRERIQRGEEGEGRVRTCTGFFPPHSHGLGEVKFTWTRLGLISFNSGNPISNPMDQAGSSKGTLDVFRSRHASHLDEWLMDELKIGLF